MKTPTVNLLNFLVSVLKKVKRMLNDIESSKAAVFDNIPPKFLKSASQELAEPVTNLVNQSIRISHFPHDLKKAELSPLYKCKDDLMFTNYRPVSVLTSLSKLFERVYNDQMAKHFMELLSLFLSAFRKHFGCHHVLTKLIDDCKSALDRGKNVGLLLLDLSKAFDCLPHRLLLCKLHAYGMSREACKLILSHLRNRHQRVKIVSVKSDWSYMIKGVPQGSGSGPGTAPIQYIP